MKKNFVQTQLEYKSWESAELHAHWIIVEKKCTKPLAKRLYQIKAIRVYSLSGSDILPMDLYGRIRREIKIISMTEYADSLKLIKLVKVSWLAFLHLFFPIVIKKVFSPIVKIAQAINYWPTNTE